MVKNQVLGSVVLSDLGKRTLAQVQRDQHFTLLCSDVSLSTKVDVYGGVMSMNCKLIKTGDFVKFHDGHASAMVSDLLTLKGPAILCAEHHQ